MTWLRAFLTGLGVVVGASIGAVLLLAVGFMAILAWYLHSTATNRILESVSSPDGTHTAVLRIEMAGGAAGSCAKHVLVFPQDVSFADAGDDDDYLVAWLDCSDVGIQWLSPNEVSITSKGQNRAHFGVRSSNRAGDVRIRLIPDA